MEHLPPARLATAKAALDESGCIRLPNNILEAWAVDPGEELLVRIEGDELRVLTRSAGLRVAQEIVREYPPGHASMADELIAERRRDAKR